VKILPAPGKIEEPRMIRKFSLRLKLSGFHPISSLSTFRRHKFPISTTQPWSIQRTTPSRTLGTNSKTRIIPRPYTRISMNLSMMTPNVTLPSICSYDVQPSLTFGGGCRIPPPRFSRETLAGYMPSVFESVGL